jgi:hypothetical protein
VREKATEFLYWRTDYHGSSIAHGREKAAPPL